MYYKKTILLSFFFFLVSCQDINISSSTQGKLVGGVLGGVIGNDISNGSAVGVIAGTLIGSAVGDAVVNSWQKHQEKISNTLENARSDTTVTWSDPDGVQYIMVPKPVAKRQGEICRTFKIIVISDQGSETVQGLACRKSRGKWVIIDN